MSRPEKVEFGELKVTCSTGVRGGSVRKIEYFCDPIFSCVSVDFLRQDSRYFLRYGVVYVHVCTPYVGRNSSVRSSLPHPASHQHTLMALEVRPLCNHAIRSIASLHILQNCKICVDSLVDAENKAPFSGLPSGPLLLVSTCAPFDYLYSVHGVHTGLKMYRMYRMYCTGCTEYWMNRTYTPSTLPPDIGIETCRE